MKKEIIETFIKRYNSGNLIPKIKWKYNATEKTLRTRGAADNKCFLADIVLNDFTEFGTENVDLCIGDTQKIEAMMSPFGEDINFSVNKRGDSILGFSISDNDCESYCAAVDPSAMDPMPKNLADIPEYHVVIPITEEFTEKFLKAKNALKDVEIFSVGMNKKGVFEIVIGYTTSNSNRIRLTPQTEPDKNKLDSALSFPIKNVFEVIKANKDISGGNISINRNGIIRVYFKDDKYTCTYYQFANKKS